MALSQKRQKALQVDRAIVERLYAAACKTFGAERVANDLRLLWTVRCQWGMSEQLPFTGGMESRTLGEVLYVAREVCGLPRQEEESVLTKTLRIDTAVQAILERSTVSLRGNSFCLTLPPGQLDRTLYEAVDKALKAMGGQWNRSAKGHVFAKDPREVLASMLHNGQLSIPKDGWFPTPRAVIERMLDLGGEIEQPCILEPSAGEGAIVDVICQRHPDIKSAIWCVERDPGRAAVLAGKGYRTLVQDFLTLQPGFSAWARFPRVYMNPPFEARQDIAHVQHAFNFLEPGGILVAIMSEGTFFAQDHRAEVFRDWLDKLGASSEPLSKDAFTPSGAHVSTRLVRLQKAKATAPIPLGRQGQLALFEE